MHFNPFLFAFYSFTFFPFRPLQRFTSILILRPSHRLFHQARELRILVSGDPPVPNLVSVPPGGCMRDTKRDSGTANHFSLPPGLSLPPSPNGFRACFEKCALSWR